MSSLDDLAALGQTARQAQSWMEDPLGKVGDLLTPEWTTTMTIEGDNSAAFEVLGGFAYYEPGAPEYVGTEFEDAAYSKFGLTRKGRIALAVGAVGLLIWGMGR